MAQAISEDDAEEPAAFVPPALARCRKFSCKVEESSAFRMMSGATSAHDFATEQAPAPEGTAPENGTGLG